MCELHSVARCESIGRRYRPRPNTKVSWTMVGSLTHAVGVWVSRGMPPIRREKRTMSEQTRIDEQLDQLVGERTSELAAANDALRKELAAERQRAEAAQRINEGGAQLILASVPGLVASLTPTDIDERRRAEDALRHSEASL